MSSDGESAPSGASPGAFDPGPIRDALALPEHPQPPIDMQSVLAGISEAEDASADVEAIHRDRYNAPNRPGAHEPLFKALIGICDARLARVSNYIKFLTRLVSGVDPFVDEPGEAEGPMWTTFDIVKVAILALASLTLLAIGVMTLGQILLASGLPGFEVAYRRYLFSGVPTGGAFALKNFGALFGEDRSRRRYSGFVHLTGVLFSLVWAWLFVSSFPAGPMSSADAVLANVLKSDGPDTSSDTGVALLFVGLVAETFLAAGFWIEIERLVQSHRRPRRRVNPRHVVIEAQITRWADHEAMLTDLRGRLLARLVSIASGRASYVKSAVNLYRLRCRGFAVRPPEFDGDLPFISYESTSRSHLSERSPK